MKNKVVAACSAKSANPCLANLCCVSPCLAKPCSAKPWSAKSWFTKSLFAAWPWAAARIRKPVLLKTASCTRRTDDASRRATHSQYSRGAHPMQRGYLTSKHLPLHSATACAWAENVRALKSCAKRSSCDNTAHSEPLAVTTMEARVFQKNLEAGIDRPLAGHIPGSGILRKTGSKRA